MIPILASRQFGLPRWVCLEVPVPCPWRARWARPRPTVTERTLRSVGRAESGSDQSKSFCWKHYAGSEGINPDLLGELSAFAGERRLCVFTAHSVVPAKAQSSQRPGAKRPEVLCFLRDLLFKGEHGAPDKPRSIPRSSVCPQITPIHADNVREPLRRNHAAISLERARPSRSIRVHSRSFAVTIPEWLPGSYDPSYASRLDACLSSGGDPG
jgi:hypothetical protein